ncbi:metallophosphoesterase family protein [Blastopirellula retiformator]|uniref:Putative metallophosphoesterase YhaO n=1 Tax=Blastopirellula retiformator TaxID=2527970 RepID=A0A5C5UXG5_9BACT|nr:DNA repair exonuclease [Blastopirellula retiformator]TWT30105.1 putative metallophosphoesterase YhaO [Blastopirellula retiformator]
MSFRFIHAADLHIDSPLQGLGKIDPAMMQRVRLATRTAFENVVELAIREEVAFVLIAGDLFDGQWQDMRTGQWTIAQFRRLETQGIRVFYIRGNHDAESKLQKSIRWPDNVSELSAKKAETIQLDDIQAAIHGRGFARPDVLEDLAAGYPAALSGYFNVGMLHTSLQGYDEHDPYAPTTIDTLRSKGYDYWALGHIHLREAAPLCEHPYVAYSGNTQGRHIREQGAKGCLVGTVTDGQLAEVRFEPTDVLRFSEVEIAVPTEADAQQLDEQIRDALSSAHESNDGRFTVARVRLTGSCQLHAELNDPLKQGNWIGRIRDAAAAISDDLCIEKVKIRTTAERAPLSRGEADLLGELAREVELLRQDPESLAALSSELKSLFEKLGAAQADLSDQRETSERMDEWLSAAEQIVLTGLEGAA